MLKFNKLTLTLSGAFAILLLMMAYVIVDHYVLTQRANKVITSSKTTVLKVRYYSEMMEFARTRTRLTSQILVTEDFFEKDDLNQKLEIFAGRFARTFQQLSQLSLDEYEKEQLQKQRSIVSVILPAQRKVVSLSMYGSPSEAIEAEKLFYGTVMAGQNDLIGLFQNLIAYNQEQAEVKLSSTSQHLSDALRNQGIISTVFLLLTLLIAIIVVSRTGSIHRRLLHDKDALEEAVSQRTVELQKSYDDLEHALESLKGSEDRYRQICQISSDWVWEMDENLRFSYFSDSFAPFAHADPSLLLGKTRQEIASEEGIKEPKWRAHIKDLEERREFKDFQYEFSMPGVGSWYFSISGSPAFDEDGKFTGYRGTGTNVTERVRAEKALELAREEAETANRAKSDFLSSMSHELRTPLNAIIGFGQILELDDAHPLNEDQLESVHQIRKGGEHLLGLINEILDLAKIESGKLSLSIEDVAPGDTVQTCLDMVRQLAAKNDIVLSEMSLDCDTCPEPCMIRADQGRFKQILLNLLSNAVKYNRKGGSVTLSCERRGNGYMRFNVIDTGMGIPEDLQEDLFVPFHRIHHEGSTIEGTGIGLAITAKLVEMMDGNIGFDSIHGEGSTFWVELPLVKKVAQDQQGDSKERATDSHGPDDAVARGTILYVEDNPANLKLMEKIFKRLPKVRMISAHTAELGLSTAEEELPDLILMDINLPGMSGIEALKQVQSSEKLHAIPVLAVSANAMPSDIEKAMKAGFKGYITKPFKIDEIMSSVKELLKSG